MDMIHDQQLTGLRVLVVEDEYLAANYFEQALRDFGCEVVGPASTAKQACELIKSQPVDAALLDINLSPGTCEPVARALRLRDRPFVFVTGYSNLSVLPEDLRGYRILAKPVDRQALHAAIVQMAHARPRQQQR